MKTGRWLSWLTALALAIPAAAGAAPVDEVAGPVDPTAAIADKPAGPIAAPMRITAVDWARPRSGQSLVRLPGLSAALHGLEVSPGARLRIRHPGGEAGVLWAEELRAWLIALGLPAARLVLQAGSEADVIQLEVVTPGDNS